MKRFLRPRVLIPAGIVALLLLAVFLYLFQPWKLFTTVEVYEAIPTTVEQVREPVTESSTNSSSTPQPEVTAEGPVVLGSGTFISHEHSTSGTVQILKLADGSRVLRIEKLKTSDGPQLAVWLSNAPVIGGIDGWRVFGEQDHVSLGALKGNVGDQNYLIPDTVDLADFTSVSIWCERFGVSFGAAELGPA